jgi:hypothetical protein
MTAGFCATLPLNYNDLLHASFFLFNYNPKKLETWFCSAE